MYSQNFSSKLENSENLEPHVYERVHRRAGIWLFFCSFVIFMTMLLGVLTRLTGSGLSMVEFRLLIDMVPPLTEKEWEWKFLAYQTSLEFQETYRDRGMSLSEFQTIFWLEYLHRLMARVLAGLVFLVPFLYYWIRYFGLNRILSSSFFVRLLWIFLLGAFQGALGWWMVRSGLTREYAYIWAGQVSVNPLLLASHSFVALSIYSLTFWLALRTISKGPRMNPVGVEKISDSSIARSVASSISSSSFLSTSVSSFHSSFFSIQTLRRSLWIFLGILFLMWISGSLVSGTRGAWVYQSFPLMHGYWIPPDLFRLDPWFLNVFLNPSFTQWTHRILASIVLITVGFLVFLSYRLLSEKDRSQEETQKRERKRTLIYLLYSIGCFVIFQIVLGFLTLLSFVPKTPQTILLATGHHMNAFLILSFVLVFLNKTRTWNT